MQQFGVWFRGLAIESQDDGGNNFRFFFVVQGGVCNLGGRGGGCGGSVYIYIKGMLVCCVVFRGMLCIFKVCVCL